MKKIFAVILLGICFSAKAEPFAYYENNYGMIVLYNEKCPIGDPEDWKFSRQIYNGMDVRSCWAKDKDPKDGTEFITNCPILKDKNGKPIIRLGGCQLVSAEYFIKGNPLHKKAFN